MNFKQETTSPTAREETYTHPTEAKPYPDGRRLWTTKLVTTIV
jgi:hypothetical protein